MRKWRIPALIITCTLSFSMVYLPFHASAETEAKKYEIIEDFESSTSENVKSGDLAINGTKSFVFTKTEDKTTVNLGELPKTSFAKGEMDGMFIRFEFTTALEKPANVGAGCMLANITTNYEASPSGDVWPRITTVEGTGEIDSQQCGTSWNKPGKLSHFSGYLFIKLNYGVGHTATERYYNEIKNLKLNLAHSQMPDGFTFVLDDIGYYKGTDFKAIAEQINADRPANPVKLINATSNMPDNRIVIGQAAKMSVTSLHSAGAKIKWESSNTSVATVDDSGNITTVGKGESTMKAYLEGTPELKSECKITVVDGYLDVSCRDTNNKAEVVFGLKPRLRAVPYYKDMAKSDIQWSVVSGPATVVDDEFDPLNYDSDLVNINQTNPVKPCLITFSGSGEVVIRASLKSDDKIFYDYKFVVIPSYKDLQEMILEAQGADPSTYTIAQWNALKEAIAKANDFMQKDVTEYTQEQIIKEVESLKKVYLKEIETIPGGNEDESSTISDDSNNSKGDVLPQTNVEFPIISVMALAVCSCCVAVIKAQKRLNNK